MPSISFAPNASLRKFGLYTMDGAGNKTTMITDNMLVPEKLPDLNIGIQANWEVDLRGKLKTQLLAATQRVQISEAAVLYTKSSIVAEVAAAYYQLLSLDNELDIIQQTAVKQKEALSFIQAQREVGKASELAVQQFTAQYLNLSILENDIQIEIGKVENAINILLGRYPTTIKRDKQSILLNDYSFAIGIPSQLLEKRPDIKMATAELEATKWDVMAARKAFYPSINITASLGFQAFDSKYLFLTPSSIAYNLLGGLTAPLVNKNAIQANFSFAKSKQIEAMYTYQQTVLNAFVEVFNYYREVQAIQEQKKIIHQKNASLTKAAENALDLFRAGRVPYLDVLIAQQNALQSNLEVINIANRNFQAKIKLYRSVGGGW
jgi:outer membrane protein TolC